MKQQTADKIGTCPYCNKTAEETEGASIMFKNGNQNITCPFCEKTYKVLACK